MKYPLLFLLMIESAVASAQVRIKLNYSKRWELTTPDSAVYIRVAVYDTTNAFFAGPVVDLYLDGKPQMKGAYKFAKKEGEFSFYYDNGQVESVGNFESGLRSGLWKYYYRNGQTKMEAEFFPVLGDEPKIHFLNDSTGEPLMEHGTGDWVENITYNDGVTASITGEFKNYERSGKWTYTMSNDRAIREEEYKNGKFVSGVLKRIAGGRIKVDEPLNYRFYLPDKLFVTEMFMAQPGINFKTYPALKQMTIGGRTIYKQVPNQGIPHSDSNDTFTIVEISASPPEGMAGFYKSVASIMHYPPDARKKKIQGKVFVQFVIDKDGSLVDVKVVKGIGGGCNEEAIRVIEEYAKDHKWIPGTQRGKAVKQNMVLSITFRLG